MALKMRQLQPVCTNHTFYHYQMLKKSQFRRLALFWTKMIQFWVQALTELQPVSTIMAEMFEIKCLESKQDVSPEVAIKDHQQEASFPFKEKTLILR